MKKKLYEPPQLIVANISPVVILAGSDITQSVDVNNWNRKDLGDYELE